MTHDVPSLASGAPATRRQALSFGGAAFAAGALGAAAMAQAEPADPHAGHDHHAHHGHASSQHQALIDAAQACVVRAEACVPHCVSLLGKGDTSLAECLESVLAMTPVCEAASRLAALDAPRLKDLVKVCSDVCDDCEKVCRKHAEHHAVCKACAESCAAFVKEAKKLIDA
jgi:Cys-rich four helix bundle protein (predicted Tat secretion target)